MDPNFNEFLITIYIKCTQCAGDSKTPVVKVIITFYEMRPFDRETLALSLFSFYLGENKEGGLID